MSREKTNTYNLEFKLSAVKLANESDKPVTQTADELGGNASTLHTWIGKYGTPKVSDKNTTTENPLYEENKRLKKEIICLTEERDFLKKAVAYFAREQRLSTHGSKNTQTNFP